MKKYYVEVNGNEYEVIIKEADERRAKFENPSERKETTKMSDQDTPEGDRSEKQDVKLSGNQVPVLSPMSGKVLSIKAAEGEEVKKGQVIITIEAMKMETEIVAPASGTLAAILITEGQKCKREQKMAIIK